jgi:signal transduction histidine kinase
MKMRVSQKRTSQKVTVDDVRMQLESHIQQNDKEQTLQGLNAASEDNSRSSRSLSQSSLMALRQRGSSILGALIIVLGILTSGSFLGIGISAALEQIEDDFARGALDTESKVADAFEDYVYAASIVHARCRHNFTRTDFLELYEYVASSGLKFKAVQFAPNISHADRPEAEAEARAFYAAKYPDVDYYGFRGFNTPDSGLVPRSNQSFYFPIHYQEPIAGNEAALDLDYYSSESRIRAVNAVFENKGPSLTDRLSLVSAGAQQSRCGVDNVASYGVVLMHPGVNLTNQPDVWPRDFSSIVVCIPDLIKRSISTEGTDSKIFIHDISDPTSGGEPVFLGAALVTNANNGAAIIEFIEEEPFNSLSEGKLFHHQNIKAANRVWTITIVSVENRWDSGMIFVIVGGFIILFASVALAFWVRTDERRTKAFNEMMQQAGHEKAALILKNARQATKTERELNDFIAHEVRNPVAAAMAACNFLQAEINKKEPLVDEESRELAREDMNIIDNALKFVNDLLRNMLDMHRAASKQLQVDMVPTDLLHDVIEPVGGMLHRRGSKVKVILDCPENFWIMADPLRLKQVILNLGRNSSKFIDEGFIRLKAEEADGNVILYVDDSGSGIPADKRGRIFAKFQESLDLLSQGTVSTMDYTVADEKRSLCS